MKPLTSTNPHKRARQRSKARAIARLVAESAESGGKHDLEKVARDFEHLPQEWRDEWARLAQQNRPSEEVWALVCDLLRAKAELAAEQPEDPFEGLPTPENPYGGRS